MEDRSADGTITWEEFVSGARYVLQISESIGDGWKWRGSWDEPGTGFLAKKWTVQFQAPGDTKEDDPISLPASSDFMEEDPGCIAGIHFPEYHFKELHMVYSEAYSVPVAYLRAVRPDGSNLGFERLWKDFLQNQNAAAESLDRMETLTQQEHPILGEPWYYLHPCSTASLMKCLWTTSTRRQPERYLLSWMSTVVSLFGCSLSHLYAVHLPEK